MKGRYNNMNFLRISEAAKKIGVTRQTLINWSKKGTFVEHHTTPSGFRLYSEEQVQEFIESNQQKKKN